MKDNFAQYLLKKNKENYDLIAEDFSSTRSSLWPELQQFSSWVEEGDRILDIGCGNGRLLNLFSDKDVSYIGLDSSSRLVKLAQQDHPGREFIVGDFLEVTFPSDTFDKAFAIAFLHHIPSEVMRLNILAEARRILKPEGILFLTVWTPAKAFRSPLFQKSKILKSRDIIRPWGKQTDLYCHFFKPKEIIHLTQKAGLSIVQHGELGEKAVQKNFYLLAQKI